MRSMLWVPFRVRREWFYHSSTFAVIGPFKTKAEALSDAMDYAAYKLSLEKPHVMEISQRIRQAQITG